MLSLSGLAKGLRAMVLVSISIFSLLPWQSASGQQSSDLFARENLVAWCIVPFDAKKRGPEERAQMLERLGVKRLAYDYRAEHIPTFDEEVEAMKRHGIEFTAWWFPTQMNDEAKLILEVIKRHRIRPQLWVMGAGDPVKSPQQQLERIEAEAARLRPLAMAAAAVGCQVGLYNHGGWFGEPENQLELIERLERDSIKNVGIVLNLHHAHDFMGRLPIVWPQIQAKTLCVNLNGMVTKGEKRGLKILHLSEGNGELPIMEMLRSSGWKGRIGIIDHRPETDSEVTLSNNLKGLDWLRRELEQPGSGGPRPFPLIRPEPPPGPMPAFDPAPLEPAFHSLHRTLVNRDRVYDFYSKQAAWLAGEKKKAGGWLEMAPAFPGLDGGSFGHWGNQHEPEWVDRRWQRADLGRMCSGVFRGFGKTVKRAVCVRLGDAGEISACFDTDTLQWVAAWTGGFLYLSQVRHGMMDGLAPAVGAAQVPCPNEPQGPAGSYLGLRLVGDRVAFQWRKAASKTEVQEQWAWAVNGQFTLRNEVPPLIEPPAAKPPPLMTTLVRGKEIPGSPWVVDTFTLPSGPLWHLGDVDFLADGTAVLCTMEGEVWLVRGVESEAGSLSWTRFATGLHQALGLKVVEGVIHVLGRDQITKLFDDNGDEMADRYECFSRAYDTSPGGHDYITGLDRDAEGRFVLASGNQGVVRLSPDGKQAEVLATGFRNPNGIAVGPAGETVAAVQEGDWTPSSQLMRITAGGHYGYKGPREGPLGHLPPLACFPRGLDNSCGGQVFVAGDRWGFPNGTLLHLSHGTGRVLAILTESGTNWANACIVPIPGDFASGLHRARFHTKDGQFYGVGTTGWGTYTPDEGCFQRLRYTGGEMAAPLKLEARENGLLLEFKKPLSQAPPAQESVAQMWDYHYGPTYGSDEYSIYQPGKAGHDVLEVKSSHLLKDGTQLFLEIPQLQAADQLHLHLPALPALARSLFFTVRRLGPAFVEFPGYAVLEKRARPANPTRAQFDPRPVAWEKGKEGRLVRMTTAAGLQFAEKEIAATPGERISVTFDNRDVVPHNVVFLKTTDSLNAVTEAANALVTAPDAFARHYVPDVPSILAHTRLTEPASSTTIHFTVPNTSGDYPYCCTFPGHVIVMRGVLKVR